MKDSSCESSGPGGSSSEKCYGPIKARKLVINGKNDVVFRNIDNLAHWAAARYAFFGECVRFDPDEHRWACFGDSSGSACCYRCLEGGFGDCWA